MDLPSLSAFPLELFSILVGEILTHHSGAQRPQYRALLCRGYMDATQPAEGAQIAPEGPAGGLLLRLRLNRTITRESVFAETDYFEWV